MPLKNNTINLTKLKNILAIIFTVVALVAIGYGGYSDIKEDVSDVRKEIIGVETKNAVQAVSDSAFKADVNKRLDSLDVRFHRLNLTTKATLDMQKEILRIVNKLDGDSG